jgi:hypothetical protein
MREKLKEVRPASRKYIEVEKHPSSKNPGILEHPSGAFKNVVQDAERDSGSKEADLTARAHTLYERALKHGGGCKDPIGDHAMEKR